jgi:Carboxypeptidase regulatory-like domain/TonB dependent receptor-like, beta-barrel
MNIFEQARIPGRPGIHALQWTVMVSFMLGCLFGPAMAWGQDASIEGVVKDQSGAVVPGAEVSVTNLDTGVVRNVISNDAGLYAAPLLKEGRYRVTCRMSGFYSQQTEIRVQVAQVARVNFQLQLGEMSDVVQVSAEAELVQSKAQDVGQVIDEKRIRELPLNGRNYLELAQLSAGVVPSSQAGRGHRTAGEGGFRSAGQHVAQNNLLLDGSDITSKTSRGPLGFQAQAVVPNVEALSEFKVLTNNTSAEYGFRQGASVVVSSKSGTNSFHGSIFAFHRNSAVSANNFFFNRNTRPGETGTKAPNYIRNQYGATVGGPVARDRTFFFASFQGTRIRQGFSGTTTVPSAAVRQGDFSQEPGGTGRNVTIYDPLTISGSGATAVRQPFPGNRIPANRIDPLARRIIDLYPLPNIAGRENLANNYFSSPGLASDFDQYDFRVDHNLNQSNRFFVRYSLRDELRSQPGPFTLPANENMGDVTDMLGHNLSANYSTILGPRLHNEFRYGWTRFITAFDIPATENLNAQFGVKNAVGTAFGQHDNGLATFSPAAFSAIGSRCCWPNDDDLITHQFSDNVLWQSGKHNVKFGVEYKFLNKYSLSARDSRGSFNFTGQYTAELPNSGPSRTQTGHSFADFLLGWASSGASLSPAGEDTNHPYWGFYVQDDWKITPRLTLNMGLRYELFRGPFHPDGPDTLGSRFVLRDDPNYLGLDDETSALLNIQFQEWAFPKDDSDCACKTDKNNFAPRLGIAYQLARNSVIRAGGGIYFGDVDYLGIENGRFYGNNPPRVRGNVSTPDFVNAVYQISEGLPNLSPVFDLKTIPPGTPGPVVVPEFLPTSYTGQWFLDVQHMLPWSTVVTVGYNGSKSSHLSLGRVATDPGPHPTINWPARLRYPLIQTITKYDNILNANYHALSLKAEKRFSDGLTFLNSFTWQHAIDYGTEILNQGEGGRVTQYVKDLYRDRARGSLDRTLAYNLSFLYELPWGRGRRWLQSGAASWFLGGWQLGGILSMISGPPLDQALLNNLNCVCKARGSVVGEPNLPESERTIDRWFNTGFVVPVTADQIARGEYGNSGRNLIDGPGWKNLDFLASKDFPMGAEGRYLQFRFEAFDFTNTPHFASPGLNLSAAGAGSISTASDPRLIQFALKFQF